MLYTASRDRLIKIWNVEYAKLRGCEQRPGRGNGDRESQEAGVNLIANLDDHSDWVNKVIYISAANTLLSCSNDTTIRVWRLKSNKEYLAKNKMFREKNSNRQVYKQHAVSTFQDHTDYVRTMDYSEKMGRLFSASDDGKILYWDLHVEKILQKYANYDATGNLSGIEKPKSSR